MTQRSLDFILIEMDSHCRYLSTNSISKAPLFYFLEDKCAVRMEIRTPAFAVINARDNGDFNTSRACEEIQPVHPKGDQSWVFIGRKS